jgi:RNA polymerase sigma-70 factor (sigma-E family)
MELTKGAPRVRAEHEHDYVEWVRASLPRLHRVAYRVLGDGDRADDAVQNALVALYRRWPRIHQVEHLDAYAHTMVVNACLADGRRLWSRVLLRPAAPDTEARGGSSQVDDRMLIRQALRRLPEPQRVVVILRFLCDLPVAEVARTLNCSEGTVKSRTSHGLRALRAALDLPETDREKGPSGVR